MAKESDKYQLLLPQMPVDEAKINLQHSLLATHDTKGETAYQAVQAGIMMGLANNTMYARMGLCMEYGEIKADLRHFCATNEYLLYYNPSERSRGTFDRSLGNLRRQLTNEEYDNLQLVYERKIRLITVMVMAGMLPRQDTKAC